jgi:hypothetical protein
LAFIIGAIVFADALSGGLNLGGFCIKGCDEKPLTELSYMFPPTTEIDPVFISYLSHENDRRESSLGVHKLAAAILGIEIAGADFNGLVRTNDLGMSDPFVPFKFLKRIVLSEIANIEGVAIKNDAHILRWRIPGVGQSKINRSHALSDPRSIKQNYLAIGLWRNWFIDNRYNCSVEIDEGAIADEKNFTRGEGICGNKKKSEKRYPVLWFTEIALSWLGAAFFFYFGLPSRNACGFGLTLAGLFSFMFGFWLLLHGPEIAWSAENGVSATRYSRSEDIRILAVVVTELKFRDVRRHILLADAVERSDDT